MDLSYLITHPIKGFPSEGLYRYNSYPSPTKQKIVFAGDVIKLLESLSWCHVHGYKDNFISYNQAIETARKRKLSMTCQPICSFMQSVLSQLGIQSRTVSFITLESSNGYSDGHRMLEYKQDGKWIIVDFSFRRLFKYKDEYLSAKELIDIGMENIEIVKFSEAPSLSYNDMTHNNYDFTFYMEELIRNDNNLFIWYQRICQSIQYH
jgi:hypothetical protein